MKKIHILIKESNCDTNKAQALVFDQCNELISIDEIEYPVTHTVDEIADELGVPSNFSITLDWIGGRPNDRK